MAKDPATSRIPRLDGHSRIPQPGSLGLAPNTTSHIRPPMSTGNTLKATQIFRAPAPAAPPTGAPTTTAAKTRPASVYAASGGAAGPLRDLGSSIKKSASGERINNAVSLLSRRTTTVLKKYFGNNNNGMIRSNSPAESPAPASLKQTPMTSSLPVTPMPGGKRAMVSSQQLTSSTPMPLLRSETFVCDEEEERKMSPHLNQSRLESTRISSLGFGQTLVMDATDANATQVLARDATRILKDTPKTMLDQAHQVMKGLAKMSSLGSPIAHEAPSLRIQAKDATLTMGPQSGLSPGFGKTMHVMSQDSVAANATHTINTSPGLGRTMLVIQPKDSTKTIASHSTGMGNLTKTIDAPGDVTKFIANGGNLTKSMDQLPLLEHMSMPSGLDAVAGGKATERSEAELDDTLDVTLTALAPDKANMKLPLNSTLNTERLLDLSGIQSPARHIQLLNLTREFMEATPHRNAAQMGRRSMGGQHTLLCLSPQSATATPHGMRLCQQTPQPVHLLSPLLKQAQSEMMLPTRTPDAEGHTTMENTLTASRSRTRYSFGLDLPDSTLDCSIELVDNSFSSSQQQLQQLQQQLLKKQSSFDMDESLGILTPDQMKEFLESPHNHNNLIHNMELQLAAGGHRMHHPNMQQLRMEQTPSPEELPLDPIEIKTEIVKQVEAAPQPPQQVCSASAGQSKLSNSFITSVTSVTSLDTGYQGDGEMSRPASRGASDHSPSNGPHLGRVSRQPSFPPPIPAAAPAAPMRRQDPMTDSDFFTESDADDVLQRGDRRAQVIDGQLYGPTMQPSASVPQMEDSCMESSGVFTDVENRCDEEMRQPELEVDPDVDMSPDDSTQTMRKAGAGAGGQGHSQQQQRPPSSCLSSSSAATTLSNRTSYCSVDGGSTKSFADEAFVPTAAAAASAGGSGSECCRSSLGLSVQPTASPRPHASLSSLCTVETYRGSTSSSSSIASPKSCKALTTITARSTNVSGTPRSSKSPRSGKASPASRKSHTPNKWDAVMNKIASNKPLIKTNYNDVKSKVSSTRAAMAAGQNSVQGSGSGSTPVQGSSNSVSKATTPSPRGSPSVSARRSPSATPKVVAPRHPLVVKRSSSTAAASKTATPSPPPSTRQPQDKGSVGNGAGVGIRSSSKSPTSPTSPPTKRLQSTLINRGHSYSKDSHKSSHSDLRLLCSGDVTATATQAAASASGSGTPKLLAKTPLRAAKKRDVRNLSISPTDLGPPPKTQQTAKGQSTRSKSSATTTPTSIQKRLNGTSTSPAATTCISNNTKSAASAKAASATATQIKQQSPQAKLRITSVKSSPIVKISEESLRSGVDSTELQELNGQSSTGCPTPPTPRDSKRASLSQESLCVCGVSDTGCKCQTEPKLKKQTESDAVATTEMLKQNEKDQENITLNVISTNKSSPVCEVIGKSCSSLTVLANPRVDITIQYPALKPYTKNNVLDYDRLTEFFDANLSERQQEQRQMMGLAVMVQFMSQKLDACACAETKEQCARDRSALEETIGLLQQTQRDCEELRQELHAKDVEWAQRQQEREHLHRTELKQADDKVMEVQMLAKQRFCELEAQLRAKDEEHKLVQEAYQLEVSHKLALKLDQLTAAEAQIMDLQSRLQKAATQEQELRDRLIRKKNIHTSSIHEAAQREQELNERVQSLTKELDTLRASKEYSERDLRDRLTLSQDEISVLRTSSQQRSPRTSTSLTDTSAAELCRLTSEADSLRCVLELKQAEISTLSKENADLKREGEERLKLANQLDLLKSKNELLQLELQTKADKEKETQQKLDELQKAYKHESMKRTRLTFDREEMVYLLKTRTEKLHNAEARLQERSLSSQDGSHSFSRSTNESSSSPTSPMIKGMIERNDSISWTLEIDGESPKVNSAKMVRRNGSLRGSNEQRSPIQRRQQSISNGHANGHTSSSLKNGTPSSVHRNGSSSSHGPNPLSQSMSATALMRGNSLSGGESESRTRSHSMCIKASASTSAVCEKRHTADATLGGDLLLPDWNEDPVCSSSPHPTQQQSEMRPRSSTMKLMSSEANALKKFQEIQESAGEAMVSGANSEDESCSASSEDMMRSSTSSTASVGSLSKRPKQPSSRMSIEEALPCTPMEVSWSEDAADAEAEA